MMDVGMERKGKARKIVEKQKCIYLFEKHLLNTYHIPVTVLRARIVSKTNKDSFPHGAYTPAVKKGKK